MKLVTLTAISLALSVIAIAVSITPPISSFLTTMNREEGKPSFDIANFYVNKFDTKIILKNNGTATAHNVKVYIGYSALYVSSASQFLPEINNDDSAVLRMLIGTFHLAYGDSLYRNYAAHITIECDELSFPMGFTFNGTY